jgi:hypothetical protein
MDLEPSQIASDWIAYARLNPTKAPDEVHDRGWVMNDCAFDHPELAWDAIKLVVSRYSGEDLFGERENEARKVVGGTAAGPLENLLAEHGPQFIDMVEAEARRDRRFMWTLGCVWKNSMNDDVWTRVQRAAGGISR